MSTIIITVITLLIFCIILVIAIIVLKKIHPDLHKIRLKPLGFAGPEAEAQFKEQINKLSKATEEEGQIKLEYTKVKSLNSQEERIKQLEKQNEILSKVLLGTSTVAISTATPYLDPERISYFKRIRDQTYKHVAELDAHSDVVEYAYPLIRECSTCYSFKQISESDKGICKKDQKEHSPDDVCDAWESYPKL
ncbi:MAG TPA: hypothetical protein DIU00_07255 [Phycisphaerales bacterium]|nr:hypothetical protein [Phycisphaerales bacterium]